MKNKKTIIGLVVILLCLAVCIVLVLIWPSGTGGEDVPQNSEAIEEPSAPAEEDPNPIPEDTEPPTEAAEEPTTPAEEEEEETEPEEENSSTGQPGGSGGFVGGGGVSGSGGGNTEETPPAEEKPEVDAAGTEKNAYTEVLNELPDAIGSVKVPAEGTLYYNVYLTEKTVLRIEDRDAYVIYNGKTYSADSSGVVTVTLSTESEDTPASFQLGSKAKSEKAFLLNFTAPLGSASNPQELTSLEAVTAEIPADRTDGYYFRWTASEHGTLTLAVERIDPRNAQCEIRMTLGDQTVSSAGTSDGAVSLAVQEDDEVTIQVIVKPAGTAAKVVFSGTFTADLGTRENPYEQSVTEIPGSFETVQIPAGEEVYYNVYGVCGKDLRIENPNAYVIYNGQSYLPDEDGVIALYLERADTRLPVLLVIGNSGETAQSVRLSFTSHPGSMDNPVVIEDISQVVADVPAGCDTGYYLQWVATDDGTVSFTGTADPETTGFDVILSCGERNAWLSDGAPVSMEVVRGDVVNIQIALEPDENWNYSAAQITLHGTLDITYGTANNPYTAVPEELPGSIDTVEIPAGQTVYYAISNVSGTIMTITDPTVTIVYNGVTYTPDADGVLTLTVKAESSRVPVTLQIGNSGESAAVYTLSFVPTTGSVSNPEEVASLFQLDTVLESNNSGYYYCWTASDNGAISLWVDEEKSTAVPYDIILSSTDSYSSYALSDSENNVVSMPVQEGDVVTIHVTTVSETGTNPAGTLAVRGAVFTGDGTKADPYMTTIIDIPGGFATMEIANGSEVNYSIYRIGGTTLTIQSEDAYVIYNDVTYTAVDGVVTVQLANVGPRETSNLIIGNTLTEEEMANHEEAETEAYLIRLAYPLGTSGNPEVLTDMTAFATSIQEGNDMGYWYTWTAPEDGKVTFRVTDATEGVEYNITLTRTGSYSQSNLTESEDGTVSIDVEAGSVVSIIVSTLPDADNKYPAAELQISGTFVPSSAALSVDSNPAAPPEQTESTTAEEPADEPEKGSQPEEKPANQSEPAEEEPSEADTDA